MRAPESVPEFFLPEAETPEEAEAFYQAVVSSVRDQGYTPRDRRIFSIDHAHDGKRWCEQVGRTDSNGSETVVAILDAGDGYLVVTPNRGFLRGMPILVRSGTVRLVVDFSSRWDPIGSPSSHDLVGLRALGLIHDPAVEQGVDWDPSPRTARRSRVWTSRRAVNPSRHRITTIPVLSHRARPAPPPFR